MDEEGSIWFFAVVLTASGVYGGVYLSVVIRGHEQEVVARRRRQRLRRRRPVGMYSSIYRR